ncbi:hypothetical protein [Rubrobacter marinus]|uniref:hypothetical protein n=1 Tax=Rubrobacter marinus TaxID=2653852 RepID=UPI001A9E9F57|nr:hypothetical protein [Rubrobacter marinus]
METRPERSRRRREEVSESTNHSPSPSGASPLGWARAAICAGPSPRDSNPLPASTPTSSASRSSAQSWCGPAIATTTTPPHHARSQGELSAVFLARPPFAP